MRTRPEFAAPLLSEAEISELLRLPRSSNRQQDTPVMRRGAAGEQPSHHYGGGTDFAEVRPYQHGDDPRHIDWRATARTATPLVRTYYTETRHPACLVIDRQASMRFGTRCRLKVAQAARLAIWLASAEIRSGREVSAVVLDRPCQWLPAQRGKQRLTELVSIITTPCPPIEPQADGVVWPRLFAGLHQRLPQGAKLVLISDFTGLDDRFKPQLAKLGRSFDTLALGIVDPAEHALTVTGPLELHWGTRTADAADARAIRQLAREQQRWHAALSRRFRRAAIPFLQLSTTLDALSDIDRELDW